MKSPRFLWSVDHSSDFLCDQRQAGAGSNHLSIRLVVYPAVLWEIRLLRARHFVVCYWKYWKLSSTFRWLSSKPKSWQSSVSFKSRYPKESNLTYKGNIGVYWFFNNLCWWIKSTGTKSMICWLTHNLTSVKSKLIENTILKARLGTNCVSFIYHSKMLIN